MVRFLQEADISRWLLLLAPVLALAVNAGVQILAVRFQKGTNLFLSFGKGFLAGFLMLVILVLPVLAINGNGFQDGYVLGVLVNVPAYMALSFCYCNFVLLGRTSVRIRIYSEIVDTPEGVCLQDFLIEYDERALMKKRVERLIESRDIIEKNGRYYAGRSRFVHVARIIFLAKRMILGRESEFEMKNH